MCCPLTYLFERATQVAFDEVMGKDPTYHATMLAADLAADGMVIGAGGLDTPEVEVALGAEQTAAKSAAEVIPRLVPWKQGGKAITAIQAIHAVTDCKGLGKVTPVVNTSCALKAWQKQEEEKRQKEADKEDRKKDAKKALKQQQGYAALKSILGGSIHTPVTQVMPAAVTPAPHNDDAPMQVHNKPEVTVDPDIDVAPHFARPSAADLHDDLAPDVAPDLAPSAVDLRGPAAVVLAGVVIYAAYSVYAVA